MSTPDPTPGEADRTLARGRFLELVARGRWEFARRTTAAHVVGVIAVTAEQELVLVEQHRPPLGRRCIELPAGLVGDDQDRADESLEDAARRELLEETGYRAARLTRFASGPVSAGLTDEVVTLFIATGLTAEGRGGGDGGEDITVHRVPLGSLSPWLAQQQRDGRAIDLKVYAAPAALAVLP